MALHDWATLSGWDGVHQVWIVELLYALKAQLPPTYRAYIGATPTFAIGTVDDGRPDVGVRGWSSNESSVAVGVDAELEPDEEVAVATLATNRALLVERGGRLVSAIELVSPRNKDRISAQIAYSETYMGYLLRGVHLLLVDVHRRPATFSFADRIGEGLGLQQSCMPAPLAIAYRVGDPSPNGGRFLAIWRRSLTIGKPLPSMRLPLSANESVLVDLDSAYQQAAEAAYLI